MRIFNNHRNIRLFYKFAFPEKDAVSITKMVDSAVHYHTVLMFNQTLKWFRRSGLIPDYMLPR